MSLPFRSRLPLSRHEIDRDYLTRERPNLFEQLWADPATRVLPLWRGQALISTAGPWPALQLLPPAAVPAADLRLYLGRSVSVSSPEPVGTPIAAVVLMDEEAAQFESDQRRWAGLRSLGTSLSDRDTGLLLQAIALANWHESHRFSPISGQPTTVEKGGWVRRDPSNGREIFPRTDAAIIVGVTDRDDRLVLGSNALWEGNRFSLLAGFVEPGESLESAVIREIYEESGLRLVDPVYLGSQPWPFPASLMLGFTATLDPDQEVVLTPDGTEILDLRWFSRDELASALPEIRLPGRSSIARAIIEEWYGGPIDADD
ncbi:MAG: NAD(+) diphosphatase [Microbacteriaceae bacterium]